MEIALDKLGKIITGNTPSKKNKDYWDSKDIVFIKPNNLNIYNLKLFEKDNEYLSEKAINKARTVDANSILVTCIGIVGKVALTTSEKTAFNQQINAIVPNKNIFPKYLAYALMYCRPRLASIANAPVVPIINKKQFSNFKVNVNLNKIDQITIVKQLDVINKIIENKNEQLNKLDELIKARFVEMFGNYPNNEKSWPVGKIKDLVLDVRYGTSKKATDGTSGKYPYLRMNNITYDGNLNLSDLKTIDLPLEDLEKYTVQKGDLLFNRTNSRDLVGKTCVYDLDKTMVLAGFIIRVRLDTTVANPVFVSKFLNTGYSKLLLRTICKNASGQSNINAKEMQNIKIYVPPISLQNEFANFVQQVDKSKFENIVYLNKMLLMKILSQLGDVSRD